MDTSMANMFCDKHNGSLSVSKEFLLDSLSPEDTHYQFDSLTVMHYIIFQLFAFLLLISYSNTIVVRNQGDDHINIQFIIEVSSMLKRDCLVIQKRKMNKRNMRITFVHKLVIYTRWLNFSKATNVVSIHGFQHNMVRNND